MNVFGGIEPQTVPRSPIPVVNRTVRFLGDDLAESERRRRNSAQRDVLQKLRQIERMEREIAFQNQRETDIIDDSDSVRDEHCPKDIVKNEFNVEIRIEISDEENDLYNSKVEQQTIEEKNIQEEANIENKIEPINIIPPLNITSKQYTSSILNMCWAVFWIIFGLSLLGVLVVCYQQEFDSTHTSEVVTKDEAKGENSKWVESIANLLRFYLRAEIGKTNFPSEDNNTSLLASNQSAFITAHVELN